MLLSSSNQKYRPYPLSYFSVAVPEMFLTSYSVTGCIFIHSGKTGNLFSLWLCSLWWGQIVGCVLACRFVRIRLFVYNIISLSSLCKLIWRHWTYKMPVRYICRVCECDKAYALSYPLYIYGAVCFQFTHLACDDWENIYFVLLSSSNRKYEL